MKQAVPSSTPLSLRHMLYSALYPCTRLNCVLMHRSHTKRASTCLGLSIEPESSGTGFGPFLFQSVPGLRTLPKNNWDSGWPRVK